MKRDQHRTRLLQIEAEAAALAGTFGKIADMAKEVLEQGGMLRAQIQFHFAIGAFMRLTKDIGALEALQGDGVTQPHRGNGMYRHQN